MKRKNMTIILGLVYMLTTSIFFHAQAMDIVSISPIDCGCPMTTESASTHHSQDAANNNCFETCLGAYDDYSLINIQEKRIPIHQPIYNSVDIYSGYPDDIPEKTLYHQLIDSGGVYQFPPTFVKITKRLE